MKKLYQCILRFLHINRKTKHTGVYHNYTIKAQCYGHSLAMDNIHGERNEFMDAHGWGIGIKRGDYLILQAKDDGRVARYVVNHIRYEHDPHDMWYAKLEHAGLKDDAEYQEMQEAIKCDMYGGSTWSRQCHKADVIKKHINKVFKEYQDINNSIYQKKEY